MYTGAEPSEHDHLGREQQLASSQLARLLRFLAGPGDAQRRLEAEIRAWEQGAEGEELLARNLEQLCPGVQLLHDRRIPRSVANIDHIALAPSGVYVIDAKRYRGRIHLERSLFTAPKLRIAGRDRTTLLRGLDKQVATVRAALEPLAPDVPVHGCLCFLAPLGGEVGLPLIRTLRVDGLVLLRARRLAKRLNRPGPLTDERARALRNELCAKLPPATAAHRP